MQQSRFFFEEEAQSKGYSLVAGVDEAGRGPLAGPLVVAACILPKELHFFSAIDDSKKLSPKKREELYFQITSNPLVVFSVITITAQVIDELNILQATFMGMQKAVESLSIQPNFVLVDGNKSPQFKVPSKAIIKGDALSCSIGAASILAKVTRDRLMLEEDKNWPEYGFSIHKGYPTKKHRDVLMDIGPCPIHRLSYSPVRNALKVKIPSP